MLRHNTDPFLFLWRDNILGFIAHTYPLFSLSNPFISCHVRIITVLSQVLGAVGEDIVVVSFQ